MRTYVCTYLPPTLVMLSRTFSKPGKIPRYLDSTWSDMHRERLRTHCIFQLMLVCQRPCAIFLAPGTVDLTCPDQKVDKNVYWGVNSSPYRADERLISIHADFLPLHDMGTRIEDRHITMAAFLLNPNLMLPKLLCDKFLIELELYRDYSCLVLQLQYHQVRSFVLSTI